MSTDDSRRVKLALIHPEHIVCILAGNRLAEIDTLAVPSLDVPPDCEVVGVDYMPAYAAFGVRLCHPSFPVVPLGNMLEFIDCECRAVRVADLVRTP